MTPTYKNFLSQELPTKLRTLTANQAPNFGIMTAHHMVEHLIYTMKSLSKRRGEPEGEMNKSQLSFQRFVAKGCPFKYRPKEGATLNELRTASLLSLIHI